MNTWRDSFLITPASCKGLVYICKNIVLHHFRNISAVCVMDVPLFLMVLGIQSSRTIIVDVCSFVS